MNTQLINKLTITLLLTITAFSGIYGQKRQEMCPGDTAVIRLHGYKYGELTWQKSGNNSEWQNIDQEEDTSYSFVVSSSRYFRAEVKTDSCDPYYSEVYEVISLPLPIEANAGTDTFDCCIPVNLKASQPENGTGEWSVIAGTEGTFEDISKYQTTFTGQPGDFYMLEWKVGTTCDTTRDTVAVSFMNLPTVARAGQDSSGACLPMHLYANSPSNGTGQWNILSGTDGVLADSSDPTTEFTGNPGNSYSLEWTISTKCDTSRDTLSVSFMDLPTDADAGKDTSQACTPIQLYANTPARGEGQWNILTGTGGTLTDADNPQTPFEGNPGSSYTLEWVIGTYCDTTRDTLSVSFLEAPTAADAGEDTSGICIPFLLKANTPSQGKGKWKLVSGTDSDIILENDTLPETYLSGNPGSDYNLEWSISTKCDTSRDTVSVSFLEAPTRANTGPDTTDACIPLDLYANSPASGSGKWKILSGTGGILGDTSDPETNFRGIPDSTYLLEWKISTVCDTSSDTIQIHFMDKPTVADAGKDTTNACSPLTLYGNKPEYGTGKWRILSGSEGNLNNDTAATTGFSGVADSSYTLEWSISTPCDTTRDTVDVHFMPEIYGAFSVDTNKVNKHDTLYFEDESTPNPSGWLWDFGDGFTSEKQNPQYTYKSSGLFTVKLVVTNGCFSDTVTREDTITVKSCSGPCDVEMVTVPGGTFDMGCTNEQTNCKDDEKPVHTVELDSFRISKYEITNCQYSAFLNAIGANSDGTYNGTQYIDMDESDCQINYSGGRFVPDTGKQSHPVVEVTWYGAKAFCEYCGGSLPTEAEWEFAARGGNQASATQYSGSGTLNDAAWYDDNSGGNIHETGELAPNELNIYDMSGNVPEWTDDWYNSEYYSISPQDNPKGPSDGFYRVIRGGGWKSEEQGCRVSARDYSGSDSVSTEGPYALNFKRSGPDVTIETGEVNGYGETDTRITLYDTDNSTEFAFDDDGGTGKFSKVEYTLPHITISNCQGNVPSSSGSFTIDVNSNVSWNADANCGWVSVSPSSSSGDGSVTVSYEENPDIVERSCKITIEGESKKATCKITQEEAEGHLNISGCPSSKVEYTAGSFTLNVDADVDWSASTDCNWATVSPSSGSGDGSITISYDKNPDKSSRSCEITVSGAGKDVTCSFTQKETKFVNVKYCPTDKYDASSHWDYIRVKSNVNWSITSCDWVSTFPSSGSGNDWVYLDIDKNTEITPRTCTISISGEGESDDCTIEQEAAKYINIKNCPTNKMDSSAGSFDLDIESNVDWTVSASEWVTVSPSNGKGNSTITVSYSKNLDKATRKCSLKVSGGGKSALCVFEQKPTKYVNIINCPEKVMDSTAGTFDLNVESNLNWTAETCSWASVNPPSDSGYVTITVSYEKNTTNNDRTCNVLLAGQEDSASCAFTQSNKTSEISFSGCPATTLGPEAGSLTLDVSSEESWNATTNCGWITISPKSGSGNGTITLSYEENPDIVPRSCKITVTDPSGIAVCNIKQRCNDPLEQNNADTSAYKIGENTSFSEDVCLYSEDQDWYSFIYQGSTYYFMVKGFWEETTGPYKIDFNRSGKKVTIETFPVSGYENTDTELYLFDSDSSELKYDDDSGIEKFSKLKYTFDSTALVYANHQLNDITPGGDDDGKAEQDETIELPVKIKNTGSADASNISAVLSTTDSDINITDSTSDFDDITSGNADYSNSSYVFEVSSSCPEKDVQFILTVESDEGTWTDTFKVHIHLPKLVYKNHEVDDSGGDGDGKAEQNETIAMPLVLKNKGSGDATNVTASLSTSDGDITITNSTVDFDKIEPGTRDTSNNNFVFDVSSDCPEKDVDFDITFTADEGSWSKTITVHIYLPDLSVSDLQIDDDSNDASTGDNDNKAEQGETIELPIELKNTGTSNATGVSATITTGAGDITIENDSVYYGTVNEGGNSFGDSSFVFTVSNSCSEKDVTFDISINSNEGSWTDKVTVHIHLPRLKYDSHSIDDDANDSSDGDGDGMAEQGEIIEMPIEIKNKGTGDATNVTATLSTSDPDITILDSVENYSGIQAGNTDTADNRYVFEVSPSCPDKKVKFTLDITSDQDSWARSFDVHIHGNDCQDPLENNDKAKKAFSIGNNTSFTENLCLSHDDKDWLKFKHDGSVYYILIEGDLSPADAGFRFTEDSVGLAADFTANRTTAEVGDTIQFTDKSSGNPANRTWYFGDGDTSSMKNPSHVYKKPGVYSVELNISDGSETDKKIKQKYITIDSSCFSNDPVLLLEEDFESYADGASPSDWKKSGNSSSKTTTEDAFSGSKSVSMKGSSGGCWKALLHKKFDNSYSCYKIELAYLFTGEGKVGCHNGHGSFGIRTAPTWTKPGVRGFSKFSTDLEIVSPSSDSILGNYNIGKWVKLTVEYEIKADNVEMKYFVDGKFVSEETLEKSEEESSPVSDFYFTITSGDTRCLYDDIKIFGY